MTIYEIDHDGQKYEVEADSPEAAAAAFAPVPDQQPKRPFLNKEAVAGVGDVAMASLMGIGETAARLEEQYVGGKSPEAAAETARSLFGYDLKTEDGKQLAKVLGYIPGKLREFVVGVGGEHAGNAMDAAGLALLGKGGYKGAKTPKVIGLHERLGAVKELHDAGVPLTLAQRSNSVSSGAVGALSDATNSLRDSGFRERQLVDYTEAALKNAGIKGKAAVPAVMGPQAAKLGAEFDHYNSVVQVPMDRVFVQRLQDLQKQASLAPEQVQGFVQRNIDHLQTQAAQNGGIIPGEALQMARTALDKATSDPTVKSFASDIRAVMDDALERNAPPKLVEQIRTTRSQYRDMKAIEDAVAGNPAGIVTPDRLFAVYSDAKRLPGTIYGRGETANHRLARAGARVIGDAGQGAGALTAIPMSGIGIAAVASKQPKLAAGVAGSMVGSRFFNENQVVAKAFGGRGRSKTSRAPTKAEALGAYQAATTPQERKRLLEELKRAYAPE